MFTDVIKNSRWLLAAAVLKFTFIALLWNTIHDSLRILPEHQHYLREWWGHPWGDTPTYFDPIDNLMKSGSYDPDYRMPGYGVVYWFFQSLLPFGAAMRMIIVFQCVMALLGNVALAKVAYMMTKNRAAFIVCLVVCCLSLKNIKWDFIFMSESLTTSCLSIAVYFFAKSVYEESARMQSALWSGLFFCWSIFLRPVYFPLIVLFAIALLFVVRKKIKGFATIGVFLLPFLIVDGFWTARNFIAHDRLIPLVKQKYIPEIADTYLGPLIDFVIVTGSPITFYDPKSEIEWYMQAVSRNNEVSPKPPPGWLHTSQFNLDSLVMIRQMITLAKDSGTSDSTRRQISADISSKLDRYRTSIRDELPFRYYLLSRLSHCRTHLITTSTDFLAPTPFSQMRFHIQILKVLYSALYVFSIVMAVFSLPAFLVSNKKMLALPLAAMYGMMISPVLGLVDVRYLAPDFPLLIVCAVYFGWWLYNSITSRTHEGGLRHSPDIQ